MKFEKITDSKIRIILSLQDMQSNNLSAENVLSNSVDSLKLLETIITRAEKELGFNPEDAKLLIEAVPSNKDCIFTITKLLDEKICYSKSNNFFIFKFETFDDFLNLCTFLNNFSYLCLEEISKSFSLIHYNGAYYLKFVEHQKSCLVIDYIKTLFNEFGKDVSNFSGIDGVLNEYGKVFISKNALVKSLSSFVKKNTYKKTRDCP